MPRAHDPRAVSADRLPTKGMGGPVPDFGQYREMSDVDPITRFIEDLLQKIKDTTGIDLFWMLDWSWTTNTIMELIRQANDLMAWLQNPIQRPPNLLARPGFSSPSAIASAPDWSWDAVVSLGTVTNPSGLPVTDPQGSARTTADGSRHSMLSNAMSDPAAVAAGQILTCQIHALVEAGFTASDDQAIRLEAVPSRLGSLQDAVVIAHCGVPTDAPTDWIAAPVGSKAVFFDVDYEVPKTDTPDTIELRAVVGESAGGDVAVRFDGARVAAAGGFLVVLSDLFDAGRQYLTDLWDAITAWLEDVFDADHWTALKTDTDAAFAVFVKKVKRALRHADADSYVPPSTSGIISDALKGNPWFGWLFAMVDDWLEPVLKIGKACADFGDAFWAAVTTFSAAPGASGAWQTMVSSIETAWDFFIRAVFVSWGSTEAQADTKAQAMPSPATATEKAIKNNPVVGWVFDLQGLADAFMDVAKAAWDSLFNTSYYAGDFTAAWNALMDKLGWSTAPTTTVGQVGSAAATKLLSGIWQPIGDYLTELPAWLEGLNTTFTGLSNAIWDYLLGGNRYDGTNRTAWSKPAGAKLELAWSAFWAQLTGQNASAAPTPGSAGAQGLWDGVSSNFIRSALDTWVHSITDPIGDFFDSVRRYINQMVEGLHLGYFDENWVWVPSLTTPNADKPGGTPVMTPGHNDDDGGGLAPSADASIPAAPTGLVAVPWWDLTVSNFPAGTITYAIAAVKSGVEGPAAQVKAFAGTLIPPNTNGRVDLAWNAVSGATYKIYRKVDATYAAAQDWRLIASPSTAGTLATPYQDKTARTGGTVAHPKSDAELAAQIVTAVQSTADIAKTNAATADGKAVDAQTAADAAALTAGTAQATADTATTAAADANSTAMVAAAKFGGVPEKNVIVQNFDPESDAEDFGVTLSGLVGGSTYIAPSGQGLGSIQTSWTQPVAPDTGLVFAFVDSLGDASSIHTVTTDDPAIQFSLVAKTGFGNSTLSPPVGMISAWVATVPTSFVNDELSITASAGNSAIIDASSTPIGGTLSGDFDLISYGWGGGGSGVANNIPDDAMLLSSIMGRSISTITATPDPGAGFVARRTTQNLVSVQDGITYGLSTAIATQDIDTGGSFTYSGGSARVILAIKSVNRPPPSTGAAVGSFARLVTDTASAPPSKTLVNGIRPLDGFYTFLWRGSADYAVDVTNSKFTVAYIGTYLVDFKFNITGSTSASFQPVVLVNGEPYSYGASSMRSAVNMALTHSCLVYAKAGDVISFGVAGATAPAVSRVSGQDHAAISLVNRSYL